MASDIDFQKTIIKILDILNYSRPLSLFARTVQGMPEHVLVTCLLQNDALDELASQSAQAATDLKEIDGRLAGEYCVPLRYHRDLNMAFVSALEGGR